MIDLTTLTQEQQYGLAYVTQRRNAESAAWNAANPDQPQLPMLTTEEYAKNVLSVACDSYYSALVEYKKTVTVEAFNAADPQKQQQVFEILGVPDVVQS